MVRIVVQHGNEERRQNDRFVQQPAAQGIDTAELITCRNRNWTWRSASFRVPCSMRAGWRWTTRSTILRAARWNTARDSLSIYSSFVVFDRETPSHSLFHWVVTRNPVCARNAFPLPSQRYDPSCPSSSVVDRFVRKTLSLVPDSRTRDGGIRCVDEQRGCGEHHREERSDGKQHAVQRNACVLLR